MPSTTTLRKNPTDTVKVWNGKQFDYVQRREAKKLVEAGTHQLAENLQAHELKFPSEFIPVAKETTPEPKKGGYKTKVAKPETK